MLSGPSIAGTVLKAAGTVAGGFILGELASDGGNVVNNSVDTVQNQGQQQQQFQAIQ